MRKILLLVICYLIASIAMAQVDIDVKELMPSLMPNDVISHSVRITVKNNSDEAKMIYLRNDPKVTGYRLPEDRFWCNPFALLGETDSMISIDGLLPLMAFAYWYKVIKPNDEFRFYFQSSTEIDTEGLVRLIVIKHYSRLPSIDELDWKDDEIIIHLPPLDQ